MRKILILVSAILVLSTTNKSYPNNPNGKWDDIIEAIAFIESGHDSTLVSPNGKHVGYLQISKILVDDCNQKANYKKYRYKDRLSKEKSIQMFHDIQRHYNPNNDIEKAIRLWNGGIGYSVSGTQEYYMKVMNYLKENIW